jgi:hypothetical protein
MSLFDERGFVMCVGDGNTCIGGARNEDSVSLVSSSLIVVVWVQTEVEHRYIQGEATYGSSMYDSRVKMRSMPADVQVRIDRCADAHVAASHPMMSALSSPQNVKTSIGHVPLKGQINTYCIHRNNPPNQPRLWHSTAQHSST